MAGLDPACVEPFEISSIRPPTENYSLTFRLSRNCGWNRCLFCPAYKLGAQFSRRGLDDVKRDVDRAKVIYELLLERGLGAPYVARGGSQEVATLIEEIHTARTRVEQTGKGTLASGQHGALQQSSLLSSPECSTGQGDEEMAWFASWFKDKPTIEDSVYHVLSWLMAGGRTCFIGDSNSLILSPEFFSEAMAYIKDTFPGIARYTIYGRTKTAATRDLEVLRAFKQAGLHRVHFGLESGNDKVLRFMQKGVMAAEHVQGCLKAEEAGLSCCVYVMPGLGGTQWSKEHAIDTAAVLTEIAPDYVRLRSLQVFVNTRLWAAVQKGEFVEATEDQVVEEIRVLVENIRADCEIVSDSAANLLNVSGRLPHDRGKMLEEIDRYLSLSEREKLAFSLESRLRSFIGQYGGLTRDVLAVVGPYLVGSRIDISRRPDHEVINAIRLIRSKLMP